MRKLSHVLALLAMVGWVAVVWAQANDPNPASQARGLFYLSNSGGAGNVPTPFPTNIVGYTYRAKWNSIEPSCGAAAGANPTNPTNACYNWTTFDSVLNSVPSNIKIAVGVIAGVNTPNWELNNLEADGTGTFSSVWNKGFTGPTQNTTTWGSRTIVTGEVYEFPIPWDPNYETDVGNMAQALATHIASASYSAQVVRIKADIINTSTEENFLMQLSSTLNVGSGSCAGGTICKGPCAGLTNNQSCTINQLDYQGTTSCNTSGSGGCGSTGDISWLTAAYTPNKVEAAYKTILASFVSAFPHVVIDSDFVSGLMPPINNSSQGGVAYTYPSGCTVSSSASADTCLVFNLINDGFAADINFAVQDNSTSDTPTTASKFILPFARQRLLGGQEGSAIGNATAYQTMMDQYVGCQGTSPSGCWNLGYMEIYDADATDPRNVTVDGWVNSVMQNPLHQGYLGSTPTPTPTPSVSQSQIMMPVR